MTLELIDGLKHLPGVKGIHFMAVGWESIVPRLIEESGLKGRKKEFLREIDQISPSDLTFVG